MTKLTGVQALLSDACDRMDADMNRRSLLLALLAVPFTFVGAVRGKLGGGERTPVPDQVKYKLSEPNPWLRPYSTREYPLWVQDLPRVGITEPLA